MSKMRLYYFDGPGRAESIRLLLTQACVPFEDIRIKREDWPKMKDKFELKQVPALEVDGKLYTQTYAILEYLGARYGYLPKGYQGLYDALWVMNTAEDIFTKAATSVAGWSPLPPKEKEELAKRVIDVDGPIFVGAIEEKLRQNVSHEFIVGNKYSIADFVLLGVYVGMEASPEMKKVFGTKLREKHPLLVKYAERRLEDFNLYYGKCNTKVTDLAESPARGEIIRILLKAINNPFEDVRVPAEKSDEKTQGLPKLSCDFCKISLSQTDAILQRVGMKYGYFSTADPEKLYKTIWWCNTLKDLLDRGTAVLLSHPKGIAGTKLAEMRAEYLERTVPTIVQAMEAKLKGNCVAEFLVGKKHSIADFYFVGVWREFVLKHKELAAKIGQEGVCPALKKYYEVQSKLL